MNPNSGPGKSPWWPNHDYTREIPKLNAYENVTTVGYVPIDYCRRDLKEVYADVSDYASWRADPNLPGCYVDGIFFDETPNEHSPSKAAFLEAITQYVKQYKYLGQRLVVHNPGCTLDDQLNNIEVLPDINVVWEESHQRFLAERPKISSNDRAHNCVMLHSVPVDEVFGVTKSLRRNAQYIFVTDRREGYYGKFGESWYQFIAAMKDQ